VTRPFARLLVAAALCAFVVAACVQTRDRCASVSCGEDRVCIDLEGGPRCVCADPLVEQDGECVDESGEGEGE
jgi:hypothetical protein